MTSRAAVGGEITTLAETPMLKEERAERTEAIQRKAQDSLQRKYPEHEKQISGVIHDMEYVAMREMITGEGEAAGRPRPQGYPAHRKLKSGCLPGHTVPRSSSAAQNTEPSPH